MKYVKQLTANAFSITESGTLERKLKVLIGRKGGVSYKCYQGIVFMGDIHAVKNFIIKKAIEA